MRLSTIQLVGLLLGADARIRVMQLVHQVTDRCVPEKKLHRISERQTRGLPSGAQVQWCDQACDDYNSLELQIKATM